MLKAIVFYGFKNLRWCAPVCLFAIIDTHPFPTWAVAFYKSCDQMTTGEIGLYLKTEVEGGWELHGNLNTGTMYINKNCYML